MSFLKQYRDIFGRPNEGIHSYRLFNLAIIDIFFSLLTSFLYTYFYNNNNNNILDTIFINNLLINIIILFIIAIFFHRLFNVNTTINKYIFGIIE